MRKKGLESVSSTLEVSQGRTMSRPRIILADDHPMVLEGLTSHLKTDFEIVGTVKTIEDLMAAAKKNDPDLIVLDLSKTSMKTFSALEQLQKMTCRAKVIVFTIDTDLAYIVMAFELGASAFVSKTAASPDLKIAIHEVLSDRIYVSPSIRVDFPQSSTPKKKEKPD